MTTALQGMDPRYKVLNIFVDHTNFTNKLRNDKILQQEPVVAARIDARMSTNGEVAVQAIAEQEETEEEAKEHGEEGQQ
jgi:hypothetical protein